MNASQIHQINLFDTSPLISAEDVVKLAQIPAIVLIGCSKSKKTKKSPASELYTSRRFKSAIELAQRLGRNYFIISGKHGLLSPDHIVSPYDLHIGKLNLAQQEAWASSLAAEITAKTTAKTLIVLADASYSNVLAQSKLIEESGLHIINPLKEFDSSLHEIWLSEAASILRRINDAGLFYDWIASQRSAGKGFYLRDLRNQKIPTRGVYIFVDTCEKNFRGDIGRVVRIGTHGVSNNSKSTLRIRLRNHLGLQTGGGNHRGSIFRLHVGRAMLNAAQSSDLLSWGDGQDASLEVRNAESVLENKVSNYLANLEVYYIPIDDPPSKHSMRASVERDLIALFTENMQIIDPSSQGWLGKNSAMPTIANSGLWNLKEVGKQYVGTWLGAVTR